MKKFAVLFLFALLVCTLAACDSSTNSTVSSSADSLFAEYPCQAEFDDNSDILILAKSEEAMNDFIDQTVQNEINAALPKSDEIDVMDSDDVLTVEKAEFKNREDANSDSEVYITVRNNSGKSATMLSINADFIDENGDVIDTDSRVYYSVLDDGQACKLTTHYSDGIPYGVRVASADVTTLPDENQINVRFSTPFVAINPNG
jgi:hypothetical protein